MASLAPLLPPSVRAFSKMVDGLQKIVEPLHISEDPTQKMVGGKMIFINFILEPYSINGRGSTLFGAGYTYSKIFNNSVMNNTIKRINISTCHKNHS